MRVQVVDGDRTARLSIAELLIVSGYDVRVYASPLAALADLEKNCWDVLITDIETCGMDGFEVLREVKARGLEVKVVLTTATGFRRKRQRALDEGALAFLEKPFEFGALEEVLGCLEKSRSACSLSR